MCMVPYVALGPESSVLQKAGDGLLNVEPFFFGVSGREGVQIQCY